MNMLQYELFASVARTLNLSKTAQQYYISQPAVSHHIKALEDSLGVELIHRSKRGVSLTEAGAELLPYVQEILALNIKAENRMNNMAKGIKGHIRAAALSSESILLSECLIPFYAARPDVQTDISLMDGADMVEALRSDDHDFYFAVNPMTPDNMGYEYRIIHTGRMALFVNKAQAGSIDLSDWSTISSLPFVSVPRADVSLNKKVTNICRSHGFSPRIINYYNRAESVILSVNAGLGVAILPENLEKLYQRPNVTVIPLDDEEARCESIFIWNPQKLSPTGELFRDIVLSTFNSTE